MRCIGQRAGKEDGGPRKQQEEEEDGRDALKPRACLGIGAAAAAAAYHKVKLSSKALKNYF